MIQQLILLTDSVEYGKRVLFQVPSHVSRMKVEDPNQKLPEFVGKFLASCGHFGMVNKQHIALDLDEEVFMNYFYAKEKNQEMVMIVDDVVVIARSAFFTHRTAIPDNDPLKVLPQLPINSISLIAIANKYEYAQTIKQLIGFLVSVLVYEQKCTDSLSQQLSLIDKSKDLFLAQVKSMMAKLETEQQQQGSNILESCLNSIRQYSEELINNIPLFCTLKNLYISANTGHEFQYSKLFRISPTLKCTELSEDSNIIHKTVLFTKRRAKEQLGQHFTKRFEFIISTIDSYPSKSLEELGVEYKISQNELKNAANILLANNLGMLIFPVLSWSRYSICLNKKHCAAQFEQLYGRSYLRTLKEMERSCEIDQINIALFLLINGIVRQSQMYVFVPKKPNPAHNYIREVLTKYSLTGTPLTQILRLEDLDSKQLIKYVSDHPGEVLIYMTE